MVALFSLFYVAAHAAVVRGACSSSLLIDNFSSAIASHSNSLNSYTSDDGTMTSISSSGNTLTFTPKSADSYFYETLPCQAATTNGYTSVSFSVTGPAGGSLKLELQTQTSCTATKYTSYFYTVSGLTGAAQTITVPLSAWTGANLNAMTSFVWSGFSQTGVAWKLGGVQLGCGSASASASSSVSSSKVQVVTSTTSSIKSSLSSSSSKPATSISSSTSVAPTKVAVSTTSTSTSVGPSATSACTNLLIDDWESQSRLTFLGYNALLQASSDDGSMKSIVVSDNTVTLTPKDTKSYFYSQLGSLNAQGIYGGISLRIKAAAGTTFNVQMQAKADTQLVSLTTNKLGWSFDGTSKLFTIPFSAYSGLDTTTLTSLYFGTFTKNVTFGPMELYCGNSGAEYIVPDPVVAPGPSYTVAAPSGTASPLVIDTFGSKSANDLGFWHGADDGMTVTWGTKKLTLQSSDPDYAFYTTVVGGGCASLAPYTGSYLHIAFTGSNKFSVALQQHNSACNDSAAPYPATWDSLEAARYTNAAGSDIYMPISHFNIDLTKTIGFALKSFYTTSPTTITKLEILPSIPSGVTIPNKLPSGNLVFGCSRPNSFAFAIDDGDPALAQQVVDIVAAENITVTFFTVGLPLQDATNNLSTVYKNMKAKGHQIALHSYTHPKLEGLPDYAAIDWEYQQDLAAMNRTFGSDFYTPYFRPPFGTEGARMRQRLAQNLGTDNPYIVMWNVDVEDYLWAQSSTPEKQLDAFKRDVAKGGNLVVMHYLYPSTVGYLREFIRIAKATGKQLMRVDQCMGDVNAPPL